MDDFIKIEFEDIDKEQREIMIALLSEMSYEGFEEEGDLLKAYILSSLYDEEALKNLAKSRRLLFSIGKVNNKNWNREWESNFDPVVINGEDGAPWVGIRASFHKPIEDVAHEIIITPKMSFGTGHHATTAMVIAMMEDMEFNGKKVLDFGTGTGILAILADRLGANDIWAIDNDDQSIKNATENFKLNNSGPINLLHASTPKVDARFDIILANIVKNVLLSNLAELSERLDDSGVLVLSGLLVADEQTILEAAKEYHLELQRRMATGNWICIQLGLKPIPKQTK